MIALPLRRVALALNAFLLVLLVAMLATACNKHRREDTIHAIFVATNAARDGWMEYDKLQQEKIVASATSLADGVAKLAKYRETQVRMLERFTFVYMSIKFALAANDGDALTAALEALKLLQFDLKKLGVSL